MSQPATTAVLPPEIIEAFTVSAVTALQELMRLEAFPAGESAGAAAIGAGPVVAVVRLLRLTPGTMTLVLPLEAARQLAESYLPSGVELADEIVNDVAAELANVIAGQAKTILKGTPYHYALSIPIVSRPQRCEDLSGAEIALATPAGRMHLLIDLRPCSGA